LPKRIKNPNIDYFIGFLVKILCLLSEGVIWDWLIEIALFEMLLSLLNYALALDDNNVEALLYSLQTYFKLNDTRKQMKLFLIYWKSHN
jgi:hypothetical protein